MIPALPPSLAPPAPFPAIVAQSFASEFVAPGVRRATYRLRTAAGPLAVAVVALDPAEPTLRFGAVVASDRLISGGETVSSMARRTHAVAGVNADYFDIGNTNQPLGAVVADGALLRTPSKRIVLDVRADRSVHFDSFAFAGGVAYGGATVPLTAVNEWPPQGGAAFLTPAYGALRAAPGVTLAELVPADAAHLPAAIGGTYRVASVADAAAQTVRGPLLAFGPAAKSLAPPPAAGDTVAVTATLTPPLETLRCAVGGGPLLVANGAPYDDPDAPAPEETARRFPVSGAGTTPGGGELLASVDGRNTSSVGLTRPEFGALLRALGATDAMAFDSGGSATLVARVLGDASASVLGTPSDGEERRVADGRVAYSDAPVGPPARLVVRPARALALAHARVPLRLAVADAAGHALGVAHLARGDAVRAGAASSVVTLRAAGLVATLPVDVAPTLARLDVVPDRRDPDAGGAVAFAAVGYDAAGRAVDLGDAVRWSADRGTFGRDGAYRAGDADARVVASAGGVRATYDLRVGRHVEAVPLFEAAHADAWRFAAAPAGAPGAVASESGDVLSLAYDFGGGERAAYADGSFALPGEPSRFEVDVRGDASGIGLRAAFVNVLGERRALTLARAVDWSGWQRRSVVLPPDLNPPVRLVALYAVDSLANAATRARGSVAFRDATVIVTGTPPHARNPAP